MEKDWLKIGGKIISLEELPYLIEKYNLLPSLIRNIIEDDNTKDFLPSEKEQLEYQQYFLNDKSISNAEQLNNWMQNNGFNEAKLSRMLFDTLRLKKFKQEKFGSNLETIFLGNKEKLDQVIYSLISTKSMEEANELYFQLDEDEASFSDLATKYSCGSEKDRNGVVGPIEMGKLRIDFSERLRVSNPGQLWPPFQIENFWMIIRLEKLISAKLDDNMNKRLIDDQYEVWINQQLSPIISKIQNQNTSYKKDDITTKGIEKDIDIKEEL